MLLDRLWFNLFFLPMGIFWLFGILCVVIRTVKYRESERSLWRWWVLLGFSLWVILCRVVIMRRGEARYLCMMLPLALPVAAMAGEEVYMWLSGRNLKRVAVVLVAVLTCVSIGSSFAKLSRFKGLKKTDYQKISAALNETRRYPGETLYILDVAKEKKRMEYFLDAGSVYIEAYMNLLFDERTAAERWAKIDDIVNKTDVLYAIVNKKEADDFLRMYEKSPFAGKIRWRTLVTASRHLLLRGEVKDDRHGRIIAEDEINAVGNSERVLWDGKLSDVAPMRDQECIAALEKRRVSVARDMYFPRSWFINPGHGFYNDKPDTVAGIDCRKREKFAEMIFVNKGRSVFGGVYSKEKLRLPRGAEGRVVFRGDNGGRFSISARIVGPDNQARLVTLKKFSVLRPDTWYEGKFVFDETLADNESVVMVIVFEGGTAAIADVRICAAENGK